MKPTNRRAINWMPIVLVAGVAIFLRVYAIDHLPPGLFGDEAVEGLDALDVLAGNLGIWFHAHLGREPLYVYLVALAYAWFGVTPLATRLPAILAGLATIPATFWFVREWASGMFDRSRANRLAWLTTALITISFWHIQMSRDAHRDTLLPLVEAIGYALLWRAFRTRDWKMYAGAGAVLGMSIYTYSPGRFVGVFVALFILVEVIVCWMTKDEGRKTDNSVSSFVFRPPSLVLNYRSSVLGLGVAALLALVVMLPLGIYFAQNPEQFSRRFASASIFDNALPVNAFVSSAAGNLVQFVVPGAGYQSKHYNLPGKPVFDLFLAPWFLAGIVIAFARLKQSQYRFLLLWFIVMATPAFLTADMIPKGVRVLGVVPGVFVFVVLAMDGLIERATGGTLREAITTTDHARLNRMEMALPNPLPMFIAASLIAFSFIGSTVWTTYDYFVAWANLPDLALAFDTDLVQASDFLNHQPADARVYISQEVYRPPTLMLLGENVPTSRYIDRATRFMEVDARTTLMFGAQDPNPIYVFIRDFAPPAEWLDRVAPTIAHLDDGEYYTAIRLGALVPPQQSLDIAFNPYLRLVGESRFGDEPRGVILFWQVVALPADRQDIDTTLALIDARGNSVAQSQLRFGAPPLEWSVGDTVIEWYAIDAMDAATQFSIGLKRGAETWQSPVLGLK